ncbi:unnamed protein product [Onchocerca flexuosa]|uniref:C2H2-type domain-containing protein n=1 Tax=Onchocerca flexuosa TaxID=387005 RepID=A0A183I2D8_9BILA|nr:unnamed protein product [Onchocerca flexuosa]
MCTKGRIWGTFPCSVCGKVFCHSSSLSRHRMQAHFKSYTCTQCNQEISTGGKRIALEVPNVKIRVYYSQFCSNRV